MKSMQFFGKDNRFHDDTPATEKHTVPAKWSSSQSVYIDKLTRFNDTDCIPYLKPDMTIRRFEVVHMSRNLGVEYAEQITSISLTDEEAEVVLYGYTKEFNVFEQVSKGESLENLTSLIDLVSRADIDINDFFDDNREYIDYNKVQKELKKLVS